MKRSVRHVVLLLLVTGFSCAGLRGQVLDQKPGSAAASSQAVKHINLGGMEPKPEEPVRAILTAFDTHEVVAIDAAHGNKDLDDFLLRLVRDPDFPTKVNDITVECGNSLYQPVLDRYIAGEDVSLSDVRQVWRNTTQPMCSVSAFYEYLFPLIRRINQKIPSERRLRVLAGDPPLDWSKVKNSSDVMLDRDGSIAAVMEKEVLSQHRKALMLFGTFHVVHSNDGPMKAYKSAVERYEKDYPGVTFVVADQIVFYNSADLAKYDKSNANERMTAWPVPSLVRNIQGTWLGESETFPLEVLSCL